MPSIIEFLDAKGIASFNETATVLVKLIFVMPATNALSERSYGALKRNLKLPYVYHDAKMDEQERRGQLKSN